jgi:hypothetical protein
LLVDFSAESNADFSVESNALRRQPGPETFPKTNTLLMSFVGLVCGYSNRWPRLESAVVSMFVIVDRHGGMHSGNVGVSNRCVLVLIWHRQIRRNQDTNGLAGRGVIEVNEMTGKVVRRKLAHSASAESRKSHGRSRITNGNGHLLPDIDGRSCIARRYRDITTAILIDQGGADQCSESRMQLIRRFAAAAVLAEQMEGRLARGEAIDIVQHSTLSSTLVRLVQRIGIDRVARDITSFGDAWRADIEERRREAEAAKSDADEVPL